MGIPVFRLESALRYRQGMEDMEKIKMMQASRVVRDEEAAADELHREKQRQCRDNNGQGLSVTALRQREVYLDQLNQRIIRQQENVEQARQLMERQRSRVVEATTRKKTLEQLKERNLAELRMQSSRSEQKNLDEVGITAYCHRAEY